MFVSKRVNEARTEIRTFVAHSHLKTRPLEGLQPTHCRDGPEGHMTQGTGRGRTSEDDTCVFLAPGSPAVSWPWSQRTESNKRFYKVSCPAPCGIEVCGIQALKQTGDVTEIVGGLSSAIPRWGDFWSVFCSEAAHKLLSPGDPPPCSSLSPFCRSPDPSPPLRPKPAGASRSWGTKPHRKLLQALQLRCGPWTTLSPLKEWDFFQMLNYEAVLIAWVQMPSGVHRLDQHRTVETCLTSTVRMWYLVH